MKKPAPPSLVDLDALNKTEHSRVVMTRATFDLWRSALVYIFYQDKTPLYVGMSSQGLFRPLNPQHVQAAQAKQDCTHVEFILCDSAEEAYAIEARLIHSLQPRHQSGIPELPEDESTLERRKRIAAHLNRTD